MSQPKPENLKRLNWPLMENNIDRQDLDTLVEYLQQDDPRLTAGSQVQQFEEQWSKWLGTRYSVFVNSGSSANLLSMSVLRETLGTGEVIVPPLTWVSDIGSVLHCGFKPIFADIDPKTLGMSTDAILDSISSETKAVFLTHILGYNALTPKLLKELKQKNILLIEDVCESHGATFNNQKLGSFGWMSNFSFYYAHHMSTIEGGMVSTNDPHTYEMLRMYRSHGMVREAKFESTRSRYKEMHDDLNPNFIFAYPGYNMRSSELNAVLGQAQLKKLDTNNKTRTENLKLFLDNLNPDLYRTDFITEGSSNYALTLVIRNPDFAYAKKVENLLNDLGVEYRRGTSGGGNQLRQPYLRKILGNEAHQDFPETEHIHFFGFYIGNYPNLPKEKIIRLTRALNSLSA